jgi:hypothetical protein
MKMISLIAAEVRQLAADLEANLDEGAEATLAIVREEIDALQARLDRLRADVDKLLQSTSSE